MSRNTWKLENESTERVSVITSVGSLCQSLIFVHIVMKNYVFLILNLFVFSPQSMITQTVVLFGGPSLSPLCLLP